MLSGSQTGLAGISQIKQREGRRQVRPLPGTVDWALVQEGAGFARPGVWGLGGIHPRSVWGCFCLPDSLALHPLFLSSTSFQIPSHSLTDTQTYVSAKEHTHTP